MSHDVNHFPIEPIKRFAKQSGTRQPVELTSFSFDANRQLHHDDSSLTYYWPISTPGASLSGGFDRLISRDESVNEHIDALLSSLIEYESMHGNNRTEVDIVSWRGMITKFLTLPFARNDGFEMNVTRLNNTIYIEEYTTDESRAEKNKRESDPRQRLMAYWGYKYEGTETRQDAYSSLLRLALATLGGTWDQTNRSELENRDQNVVNTNIQYCSVVRTRLGPVSLILGGEVDCIYDYKPSTEQLPEIANDDDLQGMRRPKAAPKLESVVDHYVELKTTKMQRSDRDRTSFERFKLLKFWAQSFLLGIPRIMVGFRDDEGRLHLEEELETLKIPGIVRAGSGSWDGNVCLNFAGEVLHFIKSTLLRGPSDGVWRVKYRSGAPSVELFLVEAEGHGKILTQAYLQHKGAHS